MVLYGYRAIARRRDRLSCTAIGLDMNRVIKLHLETHTKQ